MFYSAVKHGYICFISIFQHGMTDCASIIYCTSFWRAYIDRMSFGYAECKSNSAYLQHRAGSVVTAIFYRRIKHG